MFQLSREPLSFFKIFVDGYRLLKSGIGTIIFCNLLSLGLILLIAIAFLCIMYFFPPSDVVGICIFPIIAFFLVTFSMIPTILCIQNFINQPAEKKSLDQFGLFSFRGKIKPYLQTAAIFIIAVLVFELVVYWVLKLIKNSNFWSVSLLIVVCFFLLFYSADLFLWYFILVLEDKKTLAAFKESRELAKGNRWRFILVIFLLFLLFMLSSFTLLLLFFVLPYCWCVLIVLFYDIKQRLVSTKVSH